MSASVRTEPVIIPVSLVDIDDSVQNRLIPNPKVNRDIVKITNSYPMSVGALPVQLLSHSPKRKHTRIIVNGSGVVAFGTSESDCQAAQTAAIGEFIGSVAYINGAELTGVLDSEGTTELWAALISTSEPIASLVTPSVPATGVVVQNVNNYSVNVNINANGATITNVSVNGITVGIAAGNYIVPSAGSISIAYTVATPLWTWTSAIYSATTVISVIKEIYT